ncbi:MAG: hypothetical protein ACLP2U_11575 [Syntrophobacteraceae bacterium]
MGEKRSSIVKNWIEGLTAVPAQDAMIGLIKQEMNWSPEVAWHAGLRDTADWLTDFLAARGAAP